MSNRTTSPIVALALVAIVTLLAIAGFLASGVPGRSQPPPASQQPSASVSFPAASASAGSPSSSASAVAEASSNAPSPIVTGTAAPLDLAHLSVALRLVASGFHQPVFVTAAGDSSGRLFVVQQTGQVRIVRGGVLLPVPFLDLSDIVACCGERGLLGLAFHPGYASDGRFYVYYTDTSADHNLTIAEFRRSTSSPDVADRASESVLLRIPHGQFANHNGGMLAFGPDGMLYAGTGDGGGAGGQVGASQDLGSLLAKLIRIDVDHESPPLPYTIPSNNPFVTRSGARGEVWAYGLRNPWRWSFDRTTGDLWIGDVGQNAWEEIDHAARGVGGQDYGWNIMEGFHCYAPASGCDQQGLTPPVAEYGHDLGCAVVGGYVYRGAAFPALRGAYLFSDDCSGRIWALDAAAAGRLPVGGHADQTEVANTGRSISSFGQDDAGELYLTDLQSGEVLEVTASTR